MRPTEEIFVGTVRQGMPVVAGGDIVGQVEDVITRPDGAHVHRLVVQCASSDRRVALPADWMSHVDERGRIVLRIEPSELAHLPAYASPLPPGAARELVQRRLERHPSTAGARIAVVDRDGVLELRGTVASAGQRASASEVARSVPGVGPLRNLLGTRTTPISAVGYGGAWLRAFLGRTSGLIFDEPQTAQVAALAERKLVDLFHVAEEAALANGRARIMRHDLPLTRGLQALLGEVDTYARELELRPLLVFLADAGVPGPLDELVRQQIPRLMAALLLLSGRVIALLEPENVGPAERLERLLRRAPGRPTRWEVERATRVLDMTL